MNTIRIVKAVIESRFDTIRKSLGPVQRQLHHGFAVNDVAKVRTNINNMVMVRVQLAGYDKLINEIQILEQNAMNMAQKSISAEVQQAIDRLNAVAYLDVSQLIGKGMDKLPSKKQKKIEISHEILVFFGRDTIDGDDISKHLYEISQVTGVPLEYLETVSGRRARFDVPPPPAEPVGQFNGAQPPYSMPPNGPYPPLSGPCVPPPYIQQPDPYANAQFPSVSPSPQASFYNQDPMFPRY